MDIGVAQQASDLLLEIQALQSEIAQFDLALAEGWKVSAIKGKSSSNGGVTIMERELSVGRSADLINDLKTRSQNRLTNRQDALAALTG